MENNNVLEMKIIPQLLDMELHDDHYLIIKSSTVL